jgi:hypothetical protein
MTCQNKLARFELAVKVQHTLAACTAQPTLLFFKLNMKMFLWMDYNIKITAFYPFFQLKEASLHVRFSSQILEYNAVKTF